MTTDSKEYWAWLTSLPPQPPPIQLPAEQLPRVGDRVWLLSGTMAETTVQELKVTRIGGRMRYYVLTRADGGITTALPEDFYSAGQPDLPQGFYVVDPRRASLPAAQQEPDETRSEPSPERT